MLQGGGLAEPAADVPPGKGSVQDMPGEGGCLNGAAFTVSVVPAHSCADTLL
jgi:hypothetical protein